MRTILFVTLWLSAAAAVAQSVEVSVRNGQLLGTEQGDVAVFKGIPYASPPTGVHRWRAPEPRSDWQGVRLANQFAPQCIQSAYPSGSMFTRPSPLASEDCLYLNIWSSNLEGKKPQAVMVWIHGGGLTRGSGASSIYEGSRLARKGVVVVTINYRLGPFGYLAHPALSKEAQQLGQAPSSGNYGTLDQVAALQWVQDNIANFGGDPNRVTLFGESAGSWSVNHMTATPLAAGLFQRAIGQSGAKFDPMPELATSHPDQPAAEVTGINFAKHAGADSLTDLRAMPAHALLAAFETFKDGRIAQPNVDGYVFPDHIARIFESGKHNAVDLIVGSNANEAINLLPPPKNAAAASAYIEGVGGALTSQLRTVYGADKDWRNAYYQVFRDEIFTWNMNQWARLSAQHGSNTYLYYFTFEPPSPMQGKLGAYHAAEIRYVFDNAAVSFDGSTATAAEQRLGDIVSDYWVSFAKTGKPQSATAATWPRFQARKPRYLEIAAQPTAHKGALLKAKLAVIDQVMQARWQARNDQGQQAAAR